MIEIFWMLLRIIILTYVVKINPLIYVYLSIISFFNVYICGNILEEVKVNIYTYKYLLETVFYYTYYITILIFKLLKKNKTEQKSRIEKLVFKTDIFNEN